MSPSELREHLQILREFRVQQASVTGAGLTVVFEPEMTLPEIPGEPEPGGWKRLPALGITPAEPPSGLDEAPGFEDDTVVRVAE